MDIHQDAQDEAYRSNKNYFQHFLDNEVSRIVPPSASKCFQPLIRTTITIIPRKFD